METDLRYACVVAQAANSTWKGECDATGAGGTKRPTNDDGTTTTEGDRQCPCPTGETEDGAGKAEGSGMPTEGGVRGPKTASADSSDARVSEDATVMPCTAAGVESHPHVVSVATATTLLPTTTVSPPGVATSPAASNVSRSSSELTRGRCLPSPLHAVVYYQNRFVTIDGVTDCPVTAAPNIRLSTRSTSNLPAMNAIELDLTDSAGRKPTHGQAAAKFGQSVLAKLTRLLQDNRMAAGDAETPPKKEQGRSNPVLRKILNIIFLSTGIILLLAVVVVIIYTSISAFSRDTARLGERRTAGGCGYEWSIDEDRCNRGTN
ncbi:hypothetical protein NP493_541g02018 [Ridgeia piscesae]|uniref:Uncharacterized protein n=1 Tax=Ridgeia piscesae TaxID=27915 RepID=A0AAD9NT69_RIDPI|nr:hypothetical protein NP493_541g02018 [Ridgeia piscesae]